MFSTMTTEASTMMPKSIAPIEIRLAESPRTTMRMKAKSSESGNESATTTEARRSPRKARRMRATKTIPPVSGRVTVGRDCDVSEILSVTKEADPAHVVALHAKLQVVGADIGIAVGNRRHDLRDGDVEGDELVRV